MNVREELFKNQDLKYKAFHKNLIPTVSDEDIIGVRVPVLRKIAKQAVKDNVYIGEDYYEEKMLRGFAVGYKKCTIEEHLEELKRFIPLIDNWAVCDCCCSTYKFVNKEPETVWNFIQPYFDGNEYEIRFAVVMLMDYYLTDDYIERSLNILQTLKSDCYYVNMAIAWAISVAFVKYEQAVCDILENRILSSWVHNKSIQKIRESCRVSKEMKDYLNTLKINKV